MRATGLKSANTPALTEALTPAFISKQVRKARLFFFDLERSRERRMRVVCGGYEECAETYTINRSGFDWLSLEFVSEGRGSLTIGGREQTLRPGMFFLYGPRIPHRIESNPSKPLAKYFVDFTGTEARTLLDALGIPPGFVGESLKPGLLRDDFETLLKQGSSKGRFTSLVCVSRLTELLINCGENVAAPGSVGSRAYSTFERCRGQIEENLVRLRSLRDVARLCHVDPAYLCRLFSRFARESPHQFLLRLKIARASELLLATELPVKAVAEAVGFPDPFHFSKVFRRLQGVPPARFALGRRHQGTPATGK